MRPTDTARASLVAFLFMGTCYAQSITCTIRTGHEIERQFCAAVSKQMKEFKPKTVASNRTYEKSAIAFATWSDGDNITIGSVLVFDPLGKNTVKLIFAPPLEADTAAQMTVEGLGQLLRIPVTRQSVAWIIEVRPKRR